jgi:hypothetical protein
MEFMPRSRHRHLAQFGCCGTQICFPNRLLQWKTLATHVLSRQSRTYSKQLAVHLSACCKVAELLVNEQRAWHRALINSRCRDPRIYSPGNIVFARRVMRSDASGKLKYKFTGPWRIVESLDGGSYSIAHCLHPKRFEKKHASDLTPYPAELIPFEPIDGANTRYGQLYRPIGANPFKEAGLKGFDPPAPFQVAQLFLDVGNFKDF